MMSNDNTPGGQDPENPRHATGSNCMAYVIEIGKFVAYVIFVAGVLALFIFFGVLSPQVSFAMLLIFPITYIFKKVAPFSRVQEGNGYRAFTSKSAISTITVAVSLLVSLIVALVIFRVHSTLKDVKIARQKIWHWLLIALESCIFCVIWIGGRFVLTVVREEYNYREDLVYVTHRLIRTINCTLFLVGGITPPISDYFLFETLKRCMIVLFILFFSWCIMELATYFLVISLEAWQNKFWRQSSDDKKRKKDGKFKKYAVFMAKGLRTRINILLFFLLIIVAWIFYVRHQLSWITLAGLNGAKEIVDLAIQIFLSLLIVAVLSFIQKYFLLLWEAHNVYGRLHKRIIETYTQLYFLAKICGSGWELFNIWWNEAAECQGRGTGGDELSPEEDQDGRSVLLTDQGVDVSGQRSVRTTGERKQNDKKKWMEQDAKVKLQQILDAATGKFVPFDILKRIAKLFLLAEDALESNRVEELQLQWEANHRHVRHSTMNQVELTASIERVYKYKLEEEAATCLYQQLKAGLSTDRDVQYGDFENWMKKAHTNCTRLGNILAGHQDSVAYLKKIMTAFLIPVCVVICLLLTKAATTQLLVAFTTPFLAATFIFGDMVKTVFQGIIFTFAIHPFDVGDTCIIEGNQLEVKRIGIWKTTFYRNGNREEIVMHPNSTLIGASIVLQHENNIDLHDSIEFNVQIGLSGYHAEREAINALIKSVEEHLESSSEFESGVHDVMMREIGETVKMEIRFKHKKNGHHMTYSECLKKKNESRFNLLQEIRTLTDVVISEYKPKIGRG